VNSTIFVAVIAGVVAMVSINNISIFLHLKQGFYLAFVIFIIMGLLIEFVSPPNTSKILMLVYSAGSIAIGVFIDATLDFYLRHFDRNLFPLEIIMWWVFAPVPLLAGIMIIRISRKKTDKKITTNEHLTTGSTPDRD
jgi:uncharacterized membrane protein